MNCSITLIFYKKKRKKKVEEELYSLWDDNEFLSYVLLIDKFKESMNYTIVSK